MGWGHIPSVRVCWDSNCCRDHSPRIGGPQTPFSDTTINQFPRGERTLRKLRSVTVAPELNQGRLRPRNESIGTPCFTDPVFPCLTGKSQDDPCFQATRQLVFRCCFLHPWDLKPGNCETPPDCIGSSWAGALRSCLGPLTRSFLFASERFSTNLYWTLNFPKYHHKHFQLFLTTLFITA